MGTKDQKKEEADVAADDFDPSSAPQPKNGPDDVRLLTAQFKQRAQGLDGHELEEEIRRFLEKLIDRHGKVVPEAMRAEHRALLRAQLENDPTLQAMIEDLRRGAKRL